MQKQIEEYSYYAIAPTTTSTSITPAQQKHALPLITTIIKDLHTFLLSFPVCRNNYRNLSEQELEMLEGTKGDVKVNCLFAGVLAVDEAVRGFVGSMGDGWREIGAGFRELGTLYARLRATIRASDLTVAIEKSMKNLQTTIKDYHPETKKSPSPTYNTTALQLQNNSLRDQLRKLQQKYRHVLMQSKNSRQTTKQTNSNSNSNSNNPNAYGLVQEPMRVSVEILQRKVRELSRQNAALQMQKDGDHLPYIKQLQNQIEVLRMQRRHSHKILDQIKHNIQQANPYNLSRYDSQRTPNLTRKQSRNEYNMGAMMNQELNEEMIGGDQHNLMARIRRRMATSKGKDRQKSAPGKRLPQLHF